MVGGKRSGWVYLKNGFLQGVGSALGATVGFAIVIALLGWILKGVGGLPVVGQWLASIIDFTNQALEARKMIGR